MSEMVERVAMAVHKTLEFERAFANTNEMVPWGKANDDQKLYARAAIEEMRDPTDAMMAAAKNAVGYYEAMIDAALQEDVKP